VVLIVALLILLLIGMLASGAYESNLLQMRMAGNTQQYSALRQQGLAMIDAILANADNFALRGGIGYRNCAGAAIDPACDERSLAVDRDRVPWRDDWHYTVVRHGPLILKIPAVAEAHASSGRHYRAALYEIRVARAGDARGRGRIALAQGVLLQQLNGKAGSELLP
jgi:hypothetical protein